MADPVEWSYRKSAADDRALAVHRVWCPHDLYGPAVNKAASASSDPVTAKASEMSQAKQKALCTVHSCGKSGECSCTTF